MSFDLEQTARFFRSIARWEHLYERKTFCFLGVKSGSSYALVQAKVFASRDWNQSLSPLGVHKTESVIVGQLNLSDLGLSLGGLAEEVKKGRLSVLGEVLDFPPDDQGRISAFFRELQPEAATAGKRMSTLMLGGKQRHDVVNKMELDWHLRAQPAPYESLDELAREYGVGDINLGFASVEFLAGHLCEVDFSAHVQETVANPGVVLPVETDKSKFAIGYRIWSGGAFVARGAFSGEQLEWRKGEKFWTGNKRIDIPAGAAVQCFTSYEGVAQFQGWIGDPKATSNPKRAIYEDIDSDLEVLKDLLFEEKKQRRESRDFEQGIAWLFWLLGFSILHPGHKRLEDNADLIAATPKGNLFVIECTTGLLSKEGKLQGLLHRAASIKKRLAKAGLSSIQVLPIGILSKPTDEVAGDIAEASKLGVLALASEDLRQGLVQSFVPTDADLYFSQATSELARRSGLLSASESAQIRY